MVEPLSCAATRLARHIRNSFLVRENYDSVQLKPVQGTRADLLNAEQQAITAAGGPKPKGGPLANKRNAVAPPKPTPQRL